MNIWWVNLIIYLIMYVIYTYFYKISTMSSKNDGALTILLQFLGGISVLLFAPFFKITFPSNINVYVFLGIAIVFYTITDRVNTTARRGMEVSVFSILGQLNTVLVILWGILFFKEEVILKKIIGSLFIIFGNIIVLYKKGNFEFNKYTLFAVLGNISMSIAVSIDVGISDQFNLPFYVCLTLIIPAIILVIIEKIRIKNIAEEFKIGNRKAILIVGLIWGIMILQMLRTYQYGEVTTITPLFATSTILNVFVAYFLLREKDCIIRKVFAAVIVILGILLINI